MALQGVHLLLTYRCDRECDHCFVWGSPHAEATMTLEFVRQILESARRIETVRMIYFEGGEPFLFYPIMLEGLRMAAGMGFDTGIVTNGYWATCPEDAAVWLRPLGQVRLVDLSVSSDCFHGGEEEVPEWRHVRQVAGQLGLPAGAISIPVPQSGASALEGDLRYRGRAAETMTEGLLLHPGGLFTECLHEELADPGRVHVDPYGYVHLCQGLVLGNVHERPLDELVGDYDPSAHPIVGPLLQGGPAALAARYDVPLEPGYVEACHMCYRVRLDLRERLPESLAPGQMYGEGLPVQTST